MKAVWRSHAGCSRAVCCERLRPTASRRQHLSTQDARSAGFLTVAQHFSKAFHGIGSHYGVERNYRRFPSTSPPAPPGSASSTVSSATRCPSRCDDDSATGYAHTHVRQLSGGRVGVRRFARTTRLALSVFHGCRTRARRARRPTPGMGCSLSPASCSGADGKWLIGKSGSPKDRLAT